MSHQKCVKNFCEDLGILMNFLMKCFKRNSVLDFDVKAFIDFKIFFMTEMGADFDISVLTEKISRH